MAYDGMAPLTITAPITKTANYDGPWSDFKTAPGGPRTGFVVACNVTTDQASANTGCSYIFQVEVSPDESITQIAAQSQPILMTETANVTRPVVDLPFQFGNGDRYARVSIIFKKVMRALNTGEEHDCGAC